MHFLGLCFRARESQMNSVQKFRFRNKIASSQFSRILAQRVNEYFQNGKISRHANWNMIFKTALGFALWIATYIWLIRGRLSSPQLIGVYVLNGFVQLHMGLNIAHDANHGAYSVHPWVNKT